MSSELSLTIWPETRRRRAAIERLHERTFGPGRYARTAFRIREGSGHLLDLSFTARIGTLLVGSVRLTPITIGERRRCCSARSRSSRRSARAASARR